MLIVAITLQLNCYASSSTVVYNKQDQMATFSAKPNTGLQAKEKTICESLNNNVFDAVVKIGSAQFALRGQTFKFNEEIALTLSCDASAETSCSPEVVDQFQIANFEWSFLRIDQKLSGTAGKFSVRWFDRTACNNAGMIKYSIDEGTEYMIFSVTSKSTCPVSPSSDSLTMVLQINGEELITSQASFSAFSAAQDGTSRIQNAESYISELQQLKLPCRSAAGVLDGQCLNATKTIILNPMERITMTTLTDYQVTKLDPSTGRSKFITNQQSATSIFSLIRPDFEDGCFVDGGNLITFFNGMAGRDIEAGPLDNCSHKIFHRFYDYDRIKVQYTAVRNADFSGQKASINIMFFGQTLRYGDSYSTFFDCSSPDNVEACEENSALMKGMPSNSSVTMNHIFQSPTNSLVQKFQFPLVLLEPVVDSVSIMVTDTKICLSMTGISEHAIYLTHISISGGGKQLDMQEDFTYTPDETLYCKTHQGDFTKELIALSNVDPKKMTAVLTLGTQRIPVTALDFYRHQQPLQYLWLSVLAATALCLSLTLSPAARRLL